MNCIKQITLSLFILLISFNQLPAVEVNELDEITMQVLDIDASDELSIQQMVKIPVPVNNSLRTQSQVRVFAKPDLTTRNNPNSASQIQQIEKK